MERFNSVFHLSFYFPVHQMCELCKLFVFAIDFEETQTAVAVVNLSYQSLVEWYCCGRAANFFIRAIPSVILLFVSRAIPEIVSDAMT